MTIAILETGEPPADLIPRFGRYDAMFRKLIGIDMPSYRVAAGEWPQRPDAHSAYIVTGSPAGVYEDEAWIGRLIDFLRDAKGKEGLVGICFGHQAMAAAFGGEVRKSDKGWGVGLHRYDLRERAEWMDEVDSIAVPASHQDQVVVQPPATQVIAASAFTPFAGLAYDDQPAISFQFHPEFDPAYAAALIESRRGRLPDPDAAIASLSAPNDSARVGGWIRAFLGLA